MRLNLLIRFAGLGAAALAFTSCSVPSLHAPEEKYYLLATNVKLPYWQTARNGFFRAGEQLKVRVEMAGPETHDPEAQKQAFQKILKENPTGILVSPANPEVLRPEIDSAIAAGVPVITMDSDAPGSKRLTFIGTNNFEAGVMAAKVAAKHLGNTGNVIVYTIPGQANLEERLRGYNSVFEHTAIKVTDTINAKGDPRVAFDLTEQLLEKKPVVDGFVCLEASACESVAEVLDRKGIKGKVLVAFDTDTETLEWIQKGGIAATIAQKPYTMGFYGLKMLDDLHHFKPRTLDLQWARAPYSLVPTFVDTGATLVDKTNVADFFKPEEIPTMEKK